VQKRKVQQPPNCVKCEKEKFNDKKMCKAGKRKVHQQQNFVKCEKEKFTNN
jgi:hypothetical protein